LLDEYKSIFIVTVDNVSSQQMHEIRQSLRGEGVVLMGKNTMVRRAIKGFLSDFPEYERILPHVKGNVGFVFTKEDLCEVREKIMNNKVQAPARAGAVAPVDVHVPAQNTGLGPEKTSFFQALHIPTKISKGTIEIINDIHLIKIGEKVGASEATLLNMLNISPFSYGLVIQAVYDNGTIFAPEVLDITPEDLKARFMNGVRNVAAVSLKIGYPTLASAPHSIVNGLKNLISIALSTDIEFEAAKMAKEYLKDPSKFAAVAAAPAAAAGESPSKAAAKEEKKEESEEEDEDMGFGLFD